MPLVYLHTMKNMKKRSKNSVKAGNRPKLDVIPDFPAFCLLVASSIMRMIIGTFGGL